MGKDMPGEQPSGIDTAKLDSMSTGQKVNMPMNVNDLGRNAEAATALMHGNVSATATLDEIIRDMASHAVTGSSTANNGEGEGGAASAVLGGDKVLYTSTATSMQQFTYVEMVTPGAKDTGKGGEGFSRG